MSLLNALPQRGISPIRPAKCGQRIFNQQTILLGRRLGLITHALTWVSDFNFSRVACGACTGCSNLDFVPTR